MRMKGGLALALALCILLSACALMLIPQPGAGTEKPLPSAASLAAPSRTNAKPSTRPVVPTARPRIGANDSGSDDFFTIAWMSDTQYLSRSYPQILLMMTQWLAKNKAAENIVYMAHTGDLVHADKAVQWKNANDAFSVLDGVLPYGVLAGNHDVGTRKMDYSSFGKFFGQARYKDRPHYGASYENNRGHYDLIDAGGMAFIFIYMGWGAHADEAGIDWINAVLKKYKDRTAFLLFHDYLTIDGEHSDAGEKLFNEIVKPNQNVKYVLCGHNHGVVRRLDTGGDKGKKRTVYQLLANYQALPMGGQGYLRLLKFKPAQGRIEVTTYSPYLDEYDYYEDKDSFVLPID